MFDKDTAIKYLNTDQVTGEPISHLSVPCGRYGSTTEACAPVAWAMARIVAEETGEEVTADSLEHAMGLVVNSHDDVAGIIGNCGTTDEKELIEA